MRREGWGNAGTCYKVFVERGTGLILGVHICGPDAHEAINLFALAVRLGLRTDDLGRSLSAYPSSGNDCRHAEVSGHRCCGSRQAGRLTRAVAVVSTT